MFRLSLSNRLCKTNFQLFLLIALINQKELKLHMYTEVWFFLRRPAAAANSTRSHPIGIQLWFLIFWFLLILDAMARLGDDNTKNVHMDRASKFGGMCAFVANENEIISFSRCFRDSYTYMYQYRTHAATDSEWFAIFPLFSNGLFGEKLVHECELANNICEYHTATIRGSRCLCNYAVRTHIQIHTVYVCTSYSWLRCN